MHREIQIKQFPIVTTHWWPKTWNEQFVWENKQYLYRFLPLVHNHVQVIWVRTCIRCVTCVCARSGSRCIHTGRRRQRLTEGVSEAWCWRAVIVTATNHILLWCCMNGIGYLHEAIWLADASVGAWKVASAPRFRHALRQALTTCVNAAWARAPAHTRHTVVCSISEFYEFGYTTFLTYCFFFFFCLLNSREICDFACSHGLIVEIPTSALQPMENHQLGSH